MLQKFVSLKHKHFTHKTKNHSRLTVKFPDNSLTFCSTPPHIAVTYITILCYQYATQHWCSPKTLS